MKKQLVSIIIPLYNSEKYIAEAIESVINQTYKNWELLIVDDCSTDKSREIVKKYASQNKQIQLIESEVNFGGPARPRNIGLKKATGKYIAFCDDDDLWLPEKLEIQVDFLEKNPDYLLVSSNSKTFPDGTNNNLFLLKNKQLKFNELVKGNKIINSSVLMQKSVIEKIGYIDEKPIVIAMEDYDYWLRLLAYKDNSAFILKKTLILYRIHNQNISLYTDKTKVTFYDKLLYVYEKHKNKIPPQTIQNIKNNKEYLNYSFNYKLAFYRNQVSLKQFIFNKKITTKDKIIITIKKTIISILKLFSK